MDSKQAMKLALEALEAKGDAWIVLERKAKAAIREALAEQPAPLTDTELINRGCHYKTELMQPAQQEPCGWQFFQDGKWHNGMETNDHRANTEAAGVPVRDVYPSPQAQRTWVGLTNVEIASACKKNGGAEWWWRDIEEFAKAIEAKLKEKNT